MSSPVNHNNKPNINSTLLAENSKTKKRNNKVLSNRSSDSSVKANRIIIDLSHDDAVDSTSTHSNSNSFQSTLAKIQSSNKKFKAIQVNQHSNSSISIPNLNNSNNINSNNNNNNNNIVLPNEATLPTLASQLNLIDQCYQEHASNFDHMDHNFAQFEKILNKYNETFSFEFDSQLQFGFMEKLDVEPHSEIFVRADLHGGIETLWRNLNEAKAAALLDKDYRCKPGKYFVFLGDYMDRGNYSLLVVQTLISFKLLNPKQVFLIRGNHECNLLNFYSKTKDYFKFVGNGSKKNRLNLLENFYQSLPLTFYISQKTTERREYVQFTHGMFELNVDPEELLNAKENSKTRPIKKTLKFSERILSIYANSKNPLYPYIKRLDHLIEESKPFRRLENFELTAYNWGDVAELTSLKCLREREWKISPADIHTYFQLTYDTHKVKMLFRGHQHGFQHYYHKNKLVVTTLPIAPEVSATVDGDVFVILKTADKVDDWRCTSYHRKGDQKSYESFSSNIYHPKASVKEEAESKQNQ
jgi:hypothetical protein